MSPLDYHKDIDAAADFDLDNEESTQTKMNANFDLMETNDQGVEDRLEDTFYDLMSSGIIADMEASVPGSGLSLTVPAGQALIGYAIDYAGASVACLANAGPGYIYFCQDSTWHVDLDATPPDDKSYFLYATYTSDGSDILTLTINARVLRPILTTLTDTVEDISVSGDDATYFVDHSALGTFVIPGKLKLNIHDNTYWYVEHLYKGFLDDASDSENAGAPEEDTPTGFWIRVTRRSGYYYADHPIVDLTWERQGIAYG